MKIVTIGRHSGNDIVISDPKISKYHLQIILENSGQYKIVDLRSLNGTYVNERRYSGKVGINSNDVIRIGDTILPWMSYFGNNVNFQYKGQQKEKGVQQNVHINIENLSSKNKEPHLAGGVKKRKGYGIASFIVSLASIFLFVFFGIASIVAVVLGIISINRQSLDKGLGIAGIIIGSFTFIIFLILILVFGAVFPFLGALIMIL